MAELNKIACAEAFLLASITCSMTLLKLHTLHCGKRLFLLTLEYLKWTLFGVWILWWLKISTTVKAARKWHWRLGSQYMYVLLAVPPYTFITRLNCLVIQVHVCSHMWHSQCRWGGREGMGSEYCPFLARIRGPRSSPSSRYATECTPPPSSMSTYTCMHT